MAPKTAAQIKKSAVAKKGTKKSRGEWHEQILLVLKQQKRLGKVSLSISKLKVLCRYPGEELSFKNNLLSKLKTQKKAVEYPQAGQVALTPEGEALAPDDGGEGLATNEVRLLMFLYCWNTILLPLQSLC